MRRLRPQGLLHCLLALLSCPLVDAAAGEVNSEQQLKAAFLINFLKYVQWPDGGDAATICLAGRDTLGPYLAGAEGRQVAGRELRVKRIAGPDQIDDCQLLFVPEADEARFVAVLHWVESRPVLTVSDSEAFIRQGGAIALVRAEGRLQFEVNAEAIYRAGLKPSSQMMRLARSVGSRSR